MNIVFDVGNVLLRWDPRALVARLLPQLARQSADVDAAVAALFGSPHWPALDAGTCSFTEAVATAALHARMDSEVVADFYERLPAQLQPLPEMVRLLEALRQRGGTRLFVLSNMPAFMQNDLLRRHAFFDGFERHVFSNEVGVSKPQPEIYRVLLQQSSLVPSETLYLDDRPENLAAAAAFGIATLLVPEQADAPLREGLVREVLAWRP